MTDAHGVFIGLALDLDVAARARALDLHWRSPSFGAGFYVFHIIIRQPEVMPDLMHQDMGDNRAERFVMLGPIVEDGPAVEPDHIRHMRRRTFGTERQADALEQAEDIELAAQTHFVEHLVGWEILDLDHEVGAERAE